MDEDAPTTPPRDFRELRDRIVALRGRLPRRLAQVAAYAVDCPDEMAFGTVARIAEAAEVQPSTLVRFAQALGYRGFGELQLLFQERLRDRPGNYDDRLSALDGGGEPSAGTLVDGFARAALRSVEQLRERVDLAAVEKAAARLAGADTLYLVGQRRSYPVTAYLAYVFAKLRIPAVLIGSAAGIDREVLALAGRRDAAIAVTFAPYASATVEHCRQLHAQGTPVVAVTDSPFSPLAPLAAELFEVTEADFAGFRTLAATMTLAMTLAVAVAERRRAAGRGQGQSPPRES